MAASDAFYRKQNTLDMVFGAADTREQCLALIGKYEDPHLADRVFDLSWTHSLVTLRQIDAGEMDAQLYGRLAAAVLYAGPALRADSGTLIKNRRGQADLWGYAISGDLPIVLLKIGDPAHIDLVRHIPETMKPRKISIGKAGPQQIDGTAEKRRVGATSR